MDLHILFGQRKESYDGEHAPEALVCWTEYDVDENAEGWQEAVAKAKAENGEHMLAMREIRVTCDGDHIRRLLLGSPAILGTVKT
jgi:hypothetical protein